MPVALVLPSSQLLHVDTHLVFLGLKLPLTFHSPITASAFLSDTTSSTILRVLKSRKCSDKVLSVFLISLPALGCIFFQDAVQSVVEQYVNQKVYM